MFDEELLKSLHHVLLEVRFVSFFLYITISDKPCLIPSYYYTSYLHTLSYPDSRKRRSIGLSKFRARLPHQEWYPKYGPSLGALPDLITSRLLFPTFCYSSWLRAKSAKSLNTNPDPDPSLSHHLRLPQPPFKKKRDERNAPLLSPNLSGLVSGLGEGEKAYTQFLHPDES